MFAFPLSWTTQSLLYELAADYAHPLPENMAVGLICLLEMLCENCMYFLLYAFPKLRKSSHNINLLTNVISEEIILESDTSAHINFKMLMEKLFKNQYIHDIKNRK